MKGGGPIVRFRANLRGDSDGGPSIHERGIRLHVFYDALRYWRIRGLFVAVGPEIEILRDGMQRLGKTPNCCSPTDATSGFVVSAVANIKIMHENRRRNDGAKKIQNVPECIFLQRFTLLLLPHSATFHPQMFITCLLLFIYSHCARRIVCKSMYNRILKTRKGVSRGNRNVIVAFNIPPIINVTVNCANINI